MKFRVNFWLTFSSAIVDVEGVKTTLKAGGPEYILSNISEITNEDTIFVQIGEISVLLNGGILRRKHLSS